MSNEAANPEDTAVRAAMGGSRLDSTRFLAAVRQRIRERGADAAPDQTSWSLIRAAAHDDEDARGLFVERYMPVVRKYLGARWWDSPYVDDLEDAIQEVFLDCFREGGALGRADPDRGSFRAFLYGVVRRRAQAFETRRARMLNKRNAGSFDPDRHPVDDTSLSVVFDRAWAKSVIQEAGDLHWARAHELGGEPLQRLEILRLRFQDGKPIRDIAALWGEDPKRVHWAYAKARDEFKTALRDVLAGRGYPREQLDAECLRVFELLA